MRYLLTSSVTLFLAAPVFAEDTALAQAANAIRPAVEAVASYTWKSTPQSWPPAKPRWLMGLGATSRILSVRSVSSGPHRKVILFSAYIILSAIAQIFNLKL